MWTIYLKELLELSRDRKAMIFTILLPTVVIPVLVILISYFVATALTKAEKEGLDYAIFGAEYAPELVKRFKQDEFYHAVALGHPNQIRKAIKNGDIQFALVIPDTYPQRIAERQQAQIALHFNNASTTNRIWHRVNKIIAQHNVSIQNTILSDLNIDESQLKAVIKPVVLKEHNVADKREDWGEKFGGVLPYLLLILCLTGAMYPAIDLGAGEKERGTLETLLLTPVPRLDMVFAKFMVIFTTGILAAVLSVTSFALWFMFFGQALAVGMIANIISAIGFADFLLIILMLVPTTAIFASLLLSISIYAKSFKEAQNYMGPLTFFMAIPAMLSFIPGVQLNWVWAMVPLTNISLAIKELIKGTVDYQMLLVIMISTTLIAGALLHFCAQWFNQEKVLFRS